MARAGSGALLSLGGSRRLLIRRAGRGGYTPEESAADSQNQTDDEQLGAGNSLRATFTVIPGKDESHKEAND